MGEEADRVAMVSDLRIMVSDLRHEIFELRDDLRNEFRNELRNEMTGLESTLTARINEEGETTRRHFNIMVEKVTDAVKLVAEVNAHHAVVLDKHETRLTIVEKKR